MPKIYCDAKRTLRVRGEFQQQHYCRRVKGHPGAHRCDNLCQYRWPRRKRKVTV